jgi:CheY-like chemotaxis protein
VPRVCVIGESDPFVARLLQRYAEESGLEPMRAQQGEQVLDLARRAAPVVIILEVELPGRVRGWEAARNLKSDPDTRGIPVVICSWFGEADARALAAPADGRLSRLELHYDVFVSTLRQAGVAL